MGIAAYVLFFLAGLGFGFAAPGKWKWLPIGFPLALAIGAAVQEGIDGALILRLIVALLLTAGGVLLGTLLEARGERGEQARYAQPDRFPRRIATGEETACPPSRP